MHDLSDALATPASYSKPVELKQLPTDGRYHGTEDGKNGLTISTSPSSSTPGGRKITIASGSKRDTPTHDLNEQLKGLQATVAQLKESHHALFDAVSTLRTNVESVVPALIPVNIATKITSALNGRPAGLDAMKSLAEGKLQGFFQKAMQNAPKSFLDPSRLLGVTSLLSGGVEGLIAAAKAQLAGLVGPAAGLVAQMDDLAAEIEDLAADPAKALARAGDLAGLRGQLTALMRANPVLGQVADLRARIQGLLDQAGPGLNFLEPQQRLANAVTHSMRFGGH